MKKFFILTGFVLVFFFGEIALTFSDRGSSFIFEDEEVAFSLKLENHYSDFDATHFIDQKLQSFIDQWKIKGASVAISKDEELVYAKGFGYADQENGEMVKPGHLFRIASVSKLITATAVMKLYEDGLLDLEENVFGPSGILDTTIFSYYKDPRIANIKVIHLLNHTGGWSKRSTDPLFNTVQIARQMKLDPPLTLDNIIEYTLSRRLYYDPGKRYSYSNIGYAILGKIIAVKSGMPYEDYVILNILKPAGIHDMHIGHSFLHEKFPNEVRYYATGKEFQSYSIDGSGELVPMYYGGNDLQLLGAAGGWVASAPELCKLLTVLDGYDNQRDILEKETLRLMADPDFAGSGLIGWKGVDDYGTWWRTGYLNGSTAMVVRQKNQVNWVILLNTSTYNQSRIQRYLASMMFGAISNVKIWPFLNLFMIDMENHEPFFEIPVQNALL